MKKAILYLSFMLLACVDVTHAQTGFNKYGFKKTPLTLSKGKYNEFFTNDEVVQIGTVRFNTRTNKVIQFLEEDTTKTNYLSDRSSIWYSVDPLAEKYPNYSPYVYCNNNPVKYTDPDGRGPELALAGAAAVLEYGLLATGVITYGAILYRNADGIIQIRDDVKAIIGVMAIVSISTQLAQYEKFKSSLEAFSDKSKNKGTKTTENNQATASTAMPNMPKNDNDKNKTEKNNQEEKKTNDQNKKIGETKKMTPKEIGDFLKEGDNWHKGNGKTNYLKEFQKQLRGDKNSDFLVDKKTNEVVLRSNKTNTYVRTGDFYKK
jgi:RHS repeat-associated protein